MTIKQLPLYLLTVAAVVAAIYFGGLVLASYDPADLAAEVGAFTQVRR